VKPHAVDVNTSRTLERTSTARVGQTGLLSSSSSSSVLGEAGLGADIFGEKEAFELFPIKYVIED
jgi:hypothetical protein